MAHFLDLPRELRDEIYRYALVTPHLRIRIPSAKERVKLRGATDFIDTWPTRDGKGAESRLFNASLLCVNRQIYHEAKDTILKNNAILFTPASSWPDLENWEAHVRNALDGGPSLSTDVHILQNARKLILNPLTPRHLVYIGKILRPRDDIMDLTILLGRMFYDVHPERYPKSKYVLEDVLSGVSFVHANKAAHVVWSGFDPAVLPYRTHLPNGSGEYYQEWFHEATEAIEKKILGLMAWDEEMEGIESKILKKRS